MVSTSSIFLGITRDPAVRWHVPIQFSWGFFKISRLTLSIWREISIDGGKQEKKESQYEMFSNNLDEF